ncbi:MAG: DUF3179 domain-containing protein [Chloroflexi bacterium]|nr:MAG: DUF3179 domain-containing protein [Chloroflexota bacterium]
MSQTIVIQHKQRSMLLIVIVAALLALVAPTALNTTTHAQPSCDDPFEGEIIRFRTSFWTLTDFCQKSVPLSEFRSGGPPPDGIPPIDEPLFETIDEARAWLQPQSPVLSVEINGDARAYPLSIMIWHEIANDIIGDVPVAVTYCPLCNSGIVFERTVNGNVLRFGVSGNLRNSDLVMWDDLTQSWWQQLTGEAVVGSMTGTVLEFVPSQMVSFGAFAEQYPDGQILSLNTGFSRSYGSSPYAGYESSPRPFLFEGSIDDRLPATERVLAGKIGGEAIAYPFSTLEVEGVINDTVGGRNIVALWQPGATAALDGRNIDQSRDVGMAAIYNRELDGQVLTFSIADDGTITDDQTGSVWNVFGTAIRGALEGSQLRQMNGAPHFWFAWAAFEPETAVFGLS